MSPTTNSSSNGIILVTGGSGFVGSHVISQLLQSGHTVRAIVRHGKGQILKNTYPNTNAKLETFEITDLAEDTFPDAFKGVTALIHLAATSYFAGYTNEKILKGAKDSMLNVVNQAIKAGVKKIVATSTIVALFDADFKRAMQPEPLTENSWNSITESDLKNLDSFPGMFVYMSGKTIAERLLWELADRHTNVDFTTIVPPVIYGPTVPHWPRPKEDSGLSTIEFGYQLIKGGPTGPNTYPDVPLSNAINVKDVAKAHILALDVAPLKDGRKKRFLVSTGQFTWADAIELIKNERPELIKRLPKPELEAPAQNVSPMDTSFAKEVLGLKEYIPWQQTFLENTDAALDWEKGKDSN